MSLTNKKRNTTDMLKFIRDELSKKYPKVEIGDRPDCFKHANGMVFNVDEFRSMNALVVEYAENEDEANKHRFEDGDLFYLDELDDAEMLKAIIAEIEG